MKTLLTRLLTLFFFLPPAAYAAPAYEALNSDGALKAGMKTTFDQIDREGGLREALDIPVAVVRYQKNGRGGG